MASGREVCCVPLPAAAGSWMWLGYFPSSFGRDVVDLLLRGVM